MPDRAQTSNEPEHQPLSIDKRKTVLAVAGAVILAGGAFTAISQMTQLARHGGALAHVSPVWLPVALAGQLFAYLGYMLAYRDAASADGGPRFSFPDTARIVIFGIGASVVAASVGGLAVDYWALRRTGTRIHTAARRVLAVGTIEWTVLSLYACTAAALVLALGDRAPLGMSAAWLAVVPACVLGALWFTSRTRVHRYVEHRPHPLAPAAGRVRRAATWLRNKLGASLADAIASVLLVRHLLSHPIRYHGATIGYPIYWAADMVTLYASLRAFGADPQAVAMVLAYATSIVIMSLPLPAGGAGGVEAGMSFALQGIGIPLGTALLGVFLYRLITFWLPIIPTLALAPSMRALSKRLPSVPRSPRDSDERVQFRPSEELAPTGAS